VAEDQMARFIQISMGSGSELSYHLLLARDLDFLKNAEYSRLNTDLEEVMRMLSSLSQKIRNALAA
jgi:four helix bundle protein